MNDADRHRLATMKKLVEVAELANLANPEEFFAAIDLDARTVVEMNLGVYEEDEDDGQKRAAAHISGFNQGIIFAQRFLVNQEEN